MGFSETHLPTTLEPQEANLQPLALSPGGERDLKEQQ